MLRNNSWPRNIWCNIEKIYRLCVTKITEGIMNIGYKLKKFATWIINTRMLSNNFYDNLYRARDLEQNENSKI